MTTQPPPAGEKPPAGWYPDPNGGPSQVYWDGQQWNANVAESAAHEPAAAGAYPPAGADGLASARGMASRLPTAGWVLLGGLLVTIIASFLPFFTLSVKGLDISESVGMRGAFRVIVFLLVAVGVGLLVPMFSGKPLDSRRLIGTTVAAALLIGLGILAYVVNSKPEGLENVAGLEVSPAFGFYLYFIGVIAATAGVVMLWMQRNKAPGPAL
jgi:lysylphosphatidylglycerol synthetase-like protein (DUF2156 family)